MVVEQFLVVTSEQWLIEIPGHGNIQSHQCVVNMPATLAFHHVDRSTSINHQPYGGRRFTSLFIGFNVIPRGKYKSDLTGLLKYQPLNLNMFPVISVLYLFLYLVILNYIYNSSVINKRQKYALTFFFLICVILL